MTHVNFLSLRIYPWQKRAFNFFWILVLLVCIGAIFALVMSYENIRLNRVLKETNALASEVDSLRAVKAATPTQSEFIRLPAQMISNPIAWHLLVETIAHYADKEIALTEISGDILSARILHVKGLSSDLPALLRLGRNLSTMKSCNALKLALSEKTNSSSNSSELSFDFECTLS